MRDISPILQSLGLLDSEIKTYLAGLELGPSTAVDLAKTTKLSRQATYTAMDSLMHRGLMSSVTRGKKRLYAAESPDKLLAYARRRESEMKTRIRDLEQAVPELKLQVGGQRPAVRMFEGKEGLRAIIEDMRSTKAKRSVELTDLEAMYSVLSPEDLKTMREELKRHGTKVRGIYAGQAGPKTLEVDRVFLDDKDGGFRSNIGIYGDHIALVTFEGKMYSVIIESEPLTKAMRLLFELAFKGADRDARD